ncbi:MAG: MarR family transcriptional regulator [Oscillospiraceae bacterium]|nr:MarR family transcriptional regulator [Oscillospiraceae bacterium]
MLITREETEIILERLVKSRPKKLFTHVDTENAGIMCLLKFLLDSGRPVTAGEISTYMHVSTARVAVLIKKLEKNSMIEKLADPSDARKTMVSISDNGIQTVNANREKCLDFFSAVIERTGKEKFLDFVKLSEEIKSAVDDELSEYEINCDE